MSGVTQVASSGVACLTMWIPRLQACTDHLEEAESFHQAMG